MNITMAELMTLNRPNIIDIRTTAQYNLGHVSNAKNIDNNILLTNPEKYLNKNETYYIYCNTGRTSYKLCQILASRGYKVVNVLGGYSAYKNI